MDDSRWVGDLFAALAFLLSLTVYGVRMMTPSEDAPRGFGQAPVKWNTSGPVIGIDLGTSYSRVGLVISQKHVEILSIPSTVCSKTCTHADLSQFCGSGIANSGVQDPIPHRQSSNFTVCEPLNAMDSSCTQNMALSPDFHITTEVENVARLLSELRGMAETCHGDQISHAVITVPVDVGETRKKAIKDAALLAGLSPIRILEEPVAVAIAYGLDSDFRSQSHALVLDIGSTARASLLRIEDGGIEVLSSTQNSSLCSEAFNRLLFDFVSDVYRTSLNDGLDANQSLVLEDQVEIAKQKLSFDEDAVVALPIRDGPWFLVPMDRNTFNTITSDLIDNMVSGTISQLLGSADVLESAIDHVILAGGSAYIPAVKDRLSGHFNGKGPLSNQEGHPDEAVVYGAALFGRRLALGYVPDPMKLYVQDATPLQFGIEVAGGVFATVIPRNSALPLRITRRLSLGGRLIRVFTGTAEYTNTTEFLGSSMLPLAMNTARLKITFELNVYGVLNVTAEDEQGRSHSTLMEPRHPSRAEMAHMHAEFAAQEEREDVKRRMETFRSYAAYYQPVLRRHLGKVPADDPQHTVQAQIVKTMEAVDTWMKTHLLSASREQFLRKLGELDVLLKQSVTFRENMASSGGDQLLV
ncbi:Hsp70 protein-domain-containing protein [Mycena galericulata]|nr:Hsp70 protein-domain-containing protein [Mycena galericulata]